VTPWLTSKSIEHLSWTADLGIEPEAKRHTPPNPEENTRSGVGSGAAGAMVAFLVFTRLFGKIAVLASHVLGRAAASDDASRSGSRAPRDGMGPSSSALDATRYETKTEAVAAPRGAGYSSTSRNRRGREADRAAAGRDSA
jgi:hypothetical protein